MKTIEIAFDENLLDQIDRFVSVTNLTYSDIMKDALRLWLKERETKMFEKEWIEKLKQHPDDPEDAEKWIPSQTWDES